MSIGHLSSLIPGVILLQFCMVNDTDFFKLNVNLGKMKSLTKRLVFCSKFVWSMTPILQVLQHFLIKCKVSYNGWYFAPILYGQ